MPDASLSVPEMSGSIPELSGGDVSMPSVGGGLDVDVAVPSVDVDASAPSASSVDLPGESVYVNALVLFFFFMKEALTTSPVDVYFICIGIIVI